MIDPEAPRLRDILRDTWSSLMELLWRATAPLRGTSAAGAWLRLLLMGIGMFAAYFGMRALIGELPDLVDSLRTFFRDLGDLIKTLFRLIVPAAEPGPVGRALPGAPSASLWVRLQILFRQLSQDDLQDFLVFFLIPLIWALGRALDIFEDTFRLNSFRAVAENLLAEYIPLFRRNMELREASLVMDTTTIHPRRVGGPMRLEVDPDSLAVLEPVRGNPRLITNTSRRMEVDAFERLHRILDLRQHTLELDQALLTRDGIQVNLEHARFGYRIRRAGDGVDKAAAFQMVYHHWLGKSWENPTTRQQDVRRLVRRELAQFVSDQKDLSDLVSGAVLSAALQEFVDYFNSRPEHGLQLTWDGDGAWVLPPVLFSPDYAATLVTNLQNQALRLELAQMIRGSLMRTEIRSMANRVLERAAELNGMGANLETKVAQLLAVYNNLLGNPP